MAKLKLTKRTIDSLPPATNKSGEFYFDTELSGFGLIDYPSGRKSFFVRYGPSHRRKRFMLGPYGILTPDEARNRAREIIGRVAAGGDPVAERQIQMGGLTFSEWVTTYLSSVERRKKDWKKDQSFLRFSADRLGHKLLADVTVEDIRKMFNHLSTEGGRDGAGVPIHANRWLASVRACLQAAWREDKLAVNPAMKVRPNPENPPRARVLTDREMERLLKHVDKLADRFARAAFTLLIETGARLSEVLRAEWGDMDLEQGLWRMPRTKAGHVQVLPLGPATVAILDALPRPGKCVIVGKDPDKPRSDLKKAWAKLQAAAEIKDVHVHDLRRTFGLHIARRAGLHVASKLLRHSDIRVTERVYAPLGIEDLRSAMVGRENEVAKLRRRGRKVT